MPRLVCSSGSRQSGLLLVFEYLPSHSLIPQEEKKAAPTLLEEWKEGLDPQSLPHTYTQPHLTTQTALHIPKMFQPPRGGSQNKCCSVLTLTRSESASGCDESDPRAV